MESVERQTGFRPPELNVPEMPECVKHVWYWFLQLNAQRSSNGFGVNPITYQDLWFFFQLEKIEPESWELDLIRKFDGVALEVYSKQQKEQAKSNKK